MKIILLKDVAGVGRKYDIKTIADGFALNMLIPKGVAIAATPEAVKRVETEKAGMVAELQVQEELLHKSLESIDGKTIAISGKANEKGHLFAGLHKAEIIPAIERDLRISIPAEYIVLEKPIKEVGDHKIEIKV